MKKVLFSMAVAMFLATSVQAQLITEDFTANQGGVAGNACVATVSGGWTRIRNSTPAGSLQAWFIPSAGVPFNAQDGSTQGYCAANYNDVAGTNTISSWLISPQVALAVGNTFSFYTRAAAGSTYPDRMELRISGQGASLNVGATNASVGDFTSVPLTINPGLALGGYPGVWTQFTYNLVAGDIGTGSGRFAFRYFVTGGGPTGANSDFIGVDTVRYSPEPTSLALLSLGALALIRRKR